jgi:hypothetical protein
MQRGGWRRVAAAAVVLATGLVVLPHGAAITTSSGEGFDTCTALPTSAMRSVTGYSAVNVYIGGVNRGCTQAQLSADWVSTVTGAGWRLIPTYVGKQAPCKNASGGVRIGSDPATAATDGTSDADDAAADMAALGLTAPNVVYDDMEAYNATDTSCAASVAAYLDAFIGRLHSDGFRVGVYGSTASTVAQLVTAYNNTARQRPDDIWIAHPGGGDTTADTAVPSGDWVHRRVRQYVFNDTLTPPSIAPSSVSIDRDVVDGDTAAPAEDGLPSYAVSGTGSLGYVRERGTPSTSGTDMNHNDAEGTVLSIVCQTTGDSVYGDTVWDQLSDGNYVSDLYTTAPGGLGFAGTLQRCDFTPTARIVAPLGGTQVAERSTVTVKVDVPVTATSVQVATSTDSGSTWHTAATTSTFAGGVATVSFTAPGANGTTVLLRAAVTDGVNAWTAINEPALHVVAPVVTMSAVPSGTVAAAYTFRWTGLDGAARPTAYDVEYQRAPWNGGFGAWASHNGWTGQTSPSEVVSLAQGYEYCVTVRAHGLFGNLGDWAPAQCIARPLDDRSLTLATSGWTRGTHSGYYDSTWTSSKTYGASLRRTGALVSRIGVLATTCATCGSVGVYVGNTLEGTISLYATRTHLQQLLMVRQFGLHSNATVTLRVRTSGKLVQIDGLLLWHPGGPLPAAG